MTSKHVGGRFLGIFFALMLCFGSMPYEAQSKCLLVPADFNNSGSTNVADVTCHILSIQASVKGNAMPDCLQVAEDAIDLNCDTTLNVVDIQLSILLVLGPPLGIKWPKSLDADGDYCVDACPPADLPATPDCLTHPGVLVHTEDFEDGADGWSTGSFHFNGTNSWALMTMAAGESELPLPSVMFGLPNSGEEAGYEASYLQTPVFDLTGGGAIVFDTFSANENNEPHDAESLLVSYDSGATWETLIESSRRFWVQYGDPNDDASIIVPGQVSAIIPADKGTSTTMFRFAYNTGDDCCGNGGVSGWYIDNVELYSNTTACYFESCGAESGICAGGQCVGATDLGPNGDQDIIAMTCSDANVQNYLGGPYTDMLCESFNGDPDGCAASFVTHDAFNFNPALPCFYDEETESCLTCDIDGSCDNSCGAIVVPPIQFGGFETDLVCNDDPSRTVYLGGDGDNACQNFDGNPSGCAQAYHFTYYGKGAASCWYDEESGNCRGCGGGNSPTEICVNTCSPLEIGCPDAPEITDYVGALTQWSPCHQYDGNEAACVQAFHMARNIYGQEPQPANCYWVAEENACRGCGRREFNGECTNQCADIDINLTCETMPELADFVGGNGQNACQVYNGNETACATAFHYSEDLNGPAPCYWDAVNTECRGCGRNFQQGDCTLSCTGAAFECAAFPELASNFIGGDGKNACQIFDGDEAGCLSALHWAQDLGNNGEPAPCYWNPDEETCRGCGNNYQDGVCNRACNPMVCAAQPGLTDFLGGNGTNACHVYDGNEAACVAAFHYADNLNAPAPCYWDDTEDSCRGCGNNFQDGDCTTSCSNCTFSSNIPAPN